MPSITTRKRPGLDQTLAAVRAADVVQRLEIPDPDGRSMRLTVDLQPDFALNQPLSPFAVAALELLDRDAPTYALDVVSVIESTLEDPRQVISAQRFKARGEAVAAMKADGIIAYDERMELLEEIGHPQPLADLLQHAHQAYRQGHPWVADYELRPKSVARDMYERAMTFVEYVGFYGLARSEGLVLRSLADAYKALRQTVPESARTDELTDLTEWLGELVRQVDSSLLDEWERLTAPQQPDTAKHTLHERPAPLTGNVRAFRVLVRNALFHRVTLAALRRYDALGGARRGERLGRRSVGRGDGAVPRGARGARHRSRRPRAGAAHHPRARTPLEGAADLRRPGGRPRLGHQRGGRSRRLRPHRSRGRPSHASQPALTVSRRWPLGSPAALDLGTRAGVPFENVDQVDAAHRVIRARDVPDHTTIARFRAEHEQALTGRFDQVLVLCARAAGAEMAVPPGQGEDTALPTYSRYVPKPVVPRWWLRTTKRRLTTSARARLPSSEVRHVSAPDTLPAGERRRPRSGPRAGGPPRAGLEPAVQRRHRLRRRRRTPAGRDRRTAAPIHPTPHRGLSGSAAESHAADPAATAGESAAARPSYPLRADTSLLTVTAHRGE
jgi:hypothetical protein